MATSSITNRVKKTLCLAAAMVLAQAAHAQSAKDIINYSDAQLNSTAKMLASAVSRTAPAQIDNVTTLLGAIYVPDTRTFIYKYQMTIPLDTSKAPSYIAHSTCSDPLRRAFLQRGISIQHVYLTPIGQQTFVVRARNC